MCYMNSHWNTRRPFQHYINICGRIIFGLTRRTDTKQPCSVHYAPYQASVNKDYWCTSLETANLWCLTHHCPRLNMANGVSLVTWKRWPASQSGLHHIDASYKYMSVIRNIPKLLALNQRLLVVALQFNLSVLNEIATIPAKYNSMYNFLNGDFWTSTEFLLLSISVLLIGQQNQFTGITACHWIWELIMHSHGIIIQFDTFQANGYLYIEGNTPGVFWAYQNNFNPSCYSFPFMEQLYPSSAMGLLPDTYNCGLRMRLECRERFLRHCRLVIPRCIMARASTHVPWCMSGSLTSGFLWRSVMGKTLPAFPAIAQPAILRIW